MASASDYLETEILDHIFNRGAWSAPANMYAALFTAAPSDAGGGTEVSGNAYGRVEIESNGTSWARTNSTISNAIAITFPPPDPSNWGTVTHWGLFDASSAGNLLFHGALTTSRSTSVGVALTFAIGALTVTAS